MLYNCMLLKLMRLQPKEHFKMLLERTFNRCQCIVLSNLNCTWMYEKKNQINLKEIINVHFWVYDFYRFFLVIFIMRKISKHIQNCTHRICSQSNKKKEEMLGNMHFWVLTIYSVLHIVICNAQKIKFSRKI